MSTSEHDSCSGYVSVPVCGTLNMDLSSMPSVGGGSRMGGYEVLAESGIWTAPVTGWYRVTVIGGGGAGASGCDSALHGSLGGNGGEDSEFGGMVARGGGGGGGAGRGNGGGGGGCGEIVCGPLYRSAGEQIAFTVGNGGIGVRGVTATSYGTNGTGWLAGRASSAGVNVPGTGGPGASNGGTCINYGGKTPAASGNGGRNGTAFGEGGGAGGSFYGFGGLGGNGHENGQDGIASGSKGGDGGSGAIIIEY